MNRPVKRALISVFHKDGLNPVLAQLSKFDVEIYSTGGTYRFIEEAGYAVQKVEDLTGYPSILGGRVKTLHPKVFGGILARPEMEGDVAELKEYEVPFFDLVIVDLYPFEETVATTDDESSIIEKIDIGGICLIRAAAKNHRYTTIISTRDQYPELVEILQDNEGAISLEQRKAFATKAFAVSSHYDGAIYNWFSDHSAEHGLRISHNASKALRYGENPHQEGKFYGPLNDLFDQLHGKAISYNNLLDIDAAVNIIEDFEETTFAILKHNNSCGLASRPTLKEAYLAALACDPVSAFGGILICNHEMDKATAEEIHKLFCEVVIAPSYAEDALEILIQKKNRIILVKKQKLSEKKQYRSLLNGIIAQDKDNAKEGRNDWKVATKRSPSEQEIADLEFATIAVKHLKSNGIALIKDQQLVGMGCGQTSRVDALKQAITKAKAFGLSLEGAVMGSDAFFPFPDCVEIAKEAGITAVIQPGGSIKDELSVNFCDENDLAMVMTGVRHFKH